MHCTKCGAELTPGAKFCVTCGAVVEAPAAAPVYAPVEPVAEPVSYAPVEPVSYAPADPVGYDPVEPAAAPAYTYEDSPSPKKEGSKVDVSAVKSQLGEILKPVAKLFSNKLIRFGVIGVLALLIVGAIVVTIIGSGNGYINEKQTVKLVENGDTLHILVDGKEIKDTIEIPQQLNKDGEPDTEYGSDELSYYTVTSESSIDNKITAIWVYGNSYEIYSEKSWDYDYYRCGDLYVLNGKKLVKVADDVSGYTLSSSGKSLAYLTYNGRDAEYEPETATLNLYTISNKKSVKISSDIDLGDWDVQISPDGKSVAYVEAEFEVNTEDEEYTTEYTLMLYNNKKSTKITDKEVNLVGISNKGKYIYAIRVDRKEGSDTTYTMYCYNNKGEGTKLGKSSSKYTGYMNKDHTQVLFYNDGKTYIANKNKEPVRVSAEELYLLAPITAGYANGTYPVSNLFNQIYYSYEYKSGTAYSYTVYDVWLIKKNPDKKQKLVSNSYSYPYMDESGKFLYYMNKSDDLLCAEISKGEKAGEKAKEIARDVSYYRVTSDRKRVYFISDGNLYSVNGKKGGKTKIVCNDNVDSMTLNKNNVLFYLVMEDDDESGELYATNNGKQGKRVMDDVVDLYAYSYDIVYAETEDALFVSTGGKKIKEVLNFD